MKHTTHIRIAGFLVLTALFLGFVGNADAQIPPSSVCPGGQIIYAQDVPSLYQVPYPDDTATINDRTGLLRLQIPQVADKRVFWPNTVDVPVFAGDTLYYRGVFAGHSLVVGLIGSAGTQIGTLTYTADMITPITETGYLRFAQGTMAQEKNWLVLCPPGSTPTPPPAPSPVPLPAPSNLNAITLSSEKIQLTWNDNATNENTYVIERSLVNSVSGFSTLITLPANSIYYEDRQLQANTTYYYRVRAQAQVTGTLSSPSNVASATTHGGPVVPQSQAPSALTQSATNVGQAFATLNASVNPNNSATNAWFEWGTSPSFGNSTSLQSLGAGTASISITFSASGLQSNTTYYFRAVAQNNSGTTQGSTLSFTTQSTNQILQGSAPSAFTNGPSSVSQSFATLNGSVNPNSSATNAWFEWGTTPSLGSTVGFQSMGSGTGSANLSFGLSNLFANTTYYFRTVAQNTFGTSQGSVVSFTTNNQFTNFLPSQSGSAPTVFTNESRRVTFESAELVGTVYPNNATTNIWFEWGETPSLSFSGGFQTITLGSVSFPYSFTAQNLSAGTSYYFRAAAQNSFGTNYGNILTFRTSIFGGSGTVSGNAPSITTSNATFITQTSALLNGSANPNSNQTTTYFEWGTSPSLGSVTPSQTVGSSNATLPLAWFLSGLNPNTTYYFRAIAQSGSGRVAGAITSFTTSGTPAITPVPTTTGNNGGTSVPATPSLSLTSFVDTPSTGLDEEVIYTLRYKNESGTRPLRRLVLKVTLPKDVLFVSANYPATEIGNVITFNSFNFAPNETSETIVRARVRDEASNGDTLVFNGVIDYLDASNRPQSVSTYATVTVGEKTDTSGLASSFFTTSIPLIWLLLIVAVGAVLALFTRRFRPQEQEVRVTSSGSAPRFRAPTSFSEEHGSESLHS